MMAMLLTRDRDTKGRCAFLGVTSTLGEEDEGSEGE